MAKWTHRGFAREGRMGKLAEQERQRRALARARSEALAAEEDDRRISERTQRWAR
jgi:hypothetical protein